MWRRPGVGIYSVADVSPDRQLIIAGERSRLDEAQHVSDLALRVLAFQRLTAGEHLDDD